MKPHLGEKLFVLDTQTLTKSARPLRLALALVQNVGGHSSDDEDQQKR